MNGCGSMSLRRFTTDPRDTTRARGRGVAFGLQAAPARLLERIGRRPKTAIPGSNSYNDSAVQPGATTLALSEEKGLRNSLREGLTASPRRYKRSAGARKPGVLWLMELAQSIVSACTYASVLDSRSCARVVRGT